MPRIAKLALVCVLTAIGSLALAAGAGAHAKLTANYRFEGTLKSSVGDAPKLEEVASGGQFDVTPIGGHLDGIWNFPVADGLRLAHATKVLGSKGKTYTFVMLVNLDQVSSYRKLVDFSNLNKDRGWYVYEKSLYPYDLDHFDSTDQRILAGEWRQIALTRNGKGFVHGYVDGHEIGEARDRPEHVALGSDKILHFLMDDGGTGESTAGSIARLRIWDDALSKDKIKSLGY